MNQTKTTHKCVMCNKLITDEKEWTKSRKYCNLTCAENAKQIYNKKYYVVNKEILQKKNRKRWNDNKLKYQITAKKWREKNIENCRKKQMEWYLKNKEEYNKKRNARAKLLRLNSYNKRKEYFQTYQKNKRKTDILYRLNSNISRRIRKDLKRFNLTKKESTQTFLSYTMKELQNHLEKQFQKGMTWTNMGIIWEIDHSTPLDWASVENDIYKLWDLQNLVPLFRSDNRKKSNSYSGNLKTTFSILSR